MLYLGSISLFYYLYASFWAVLVQLHLARPWKHRNMTKELIEELGRKNRTPSDKDNKEDSE